MAWHSTRSSRLAGVRRGAGAGARAPHGVPCLAALAGGVRAQRPGSPPRALRPRAGMRGFSVYSQTKAAQISLAETLQRDADAAGSGAGASAYCVGYVDTPMIRNFQHLGIKAMPADEAGEVGASRPRAHAPLHPVV